MNSRKNFYYAYYAISILLWGIYLYATFHSPIASADDPINKYKLTETATRQIQLSIVIPIFIIWAFGAYAVYGLQKYVSLIKGTKEESGLSKICLGIAALLFSLPFNSAFGTIRTYYTPTINPVDVLGVFPALSRADVLMYLTIATNYLSVVFTVVPYALMFYGSWTLLKVLQLVGDFKKRLFFPIFSLVLAMFIYIMLFFLNPIRQTSSDITIQPTYFLSDIVVLLTIVSPYIVAWGLGLLAALGMEVYKEKAIGIIYKAALSKLAIGFMTIVSTSIFFQIISTIGYKFADWSIAAILLFVYGLVALISVGYVFFALGVRKLKKIETV